MNEPVRIPQPDIKQVPQDRPLRENIRRHAELMSDSMPRTRPLAREELERRAQSILLDLALPGSFLGFAMVAISNVFWRGQYGATPFARRLFLLPKCLRKSEVCKGKLDSIGLQCAGCGACSIHDLQNTAERLGYQVIVAEGTPAVVMRIMEGQADAVLGVACLDSLEKAFRHIVEVGIPHVAVPLLKNGCIDTEVDLGQVREMLIAQCPGTSEHTHTYVPLLREAVRVFEPEPLIEMLRPCLHDAAGGQSDPMTATEAMAVEWLRKGGKRVRPFVTIAAYAVARHGAAVLAPDAEVSDLIPASIRKTAIAIEALHKASLVHDDIEDDDAFRYGEQTLHRRHGVGPALNIGDFLVGLGYRLISGQSADLGGGCVADILANLSSAHLELCRGQGGELLWHGSGRTLRPIDALSIYALKTAPAFEAALYAGLRAAGRNIADGSLKRYSTCIGEGYQALNDLADWQEHTVNKVTLGQDVLARRPTILRAFAIEAGGEHRLNELTSADADPEQVVEQVKALYASLGVFSRVEQLLEKLRARAGETADAFDDANLRNLLNFLVKIVL
ncbi:MAG TPA: polyprenyl synthetase family protein [Planctomycetota bacterium]|nr:polyprenyl synthetase family protein [Planctomycetota bacterium]